MHKVEFIFAGGTSFSINLSEKAILDIKGLLEAGKTAMIGATDKEFVVFPQNLVMIQVDK